MLTKVTIKKGCFITYGKFFIGKTESGHKFKTPTLRMRYCPKITPPGLDLQIPEGLDHETFLKQIGGDCYEIVEKFESIEEVFKLTSAEIKAREVPTQQRKHILRARENLRRGVLTFEYLSRRTCLDKVRENS